MIGSALAAALERDVQPSQLLFGETDQLIQYPRERIIDNQWDWTEQYLVQAMLYGSSQFEVLWPGHYLQRPDF
jgi:hypothetical protein